MKLKNFKLFETIGEDENIEEKIDEVILKLSKKKEMISMLVDTIDYIIEDVNKTLPDDMEAFMRSLQYYDDEVFESVSNIKEKLSEGGFNLKDMAEDIQFEFETIENYMKLKNK